MGFAVEVAMATIRLTGIVIRMAIPLLKILLRLVIFTGVWITYLLALLLLQLRGYLHITPNTTPYIIYDYVGLVIVSLPAVLITTQNLVRLVTRNPEFSILKSIRARNNKNYINKSISVKTDLLSKKPTGVIFGTQKNKFITKPENQDGHVLVIGGAGSGKSSCIAIPSLMSWQERIFAIDIKGELYQKTKDKRKNIKVFNPSDTTACGYNPFYILDESKNLGADMKSIVMAIIPLPPNTKDPFWINSAQNFLTGALLYFYENDFNFIEAIELIQGSTPKAIVELISKSNSQKAKMYMTQFVGLDEKTLAGIFTELSNKIMIFATDEELKASLRKTDVITPQMLEDGADIYLCLEESKLEQWNCLLTMMINQFLKHFERRTEGQATHVLFLLDEFARLGKIEAITNGLATLRSKKITITILTQSLAQLDVIYGKSNRQVIADNCQYKAILNATDAETQEYFSKIVGTYDKIKKSNSANADIFGIGKGTGVSTTTEEKRIIKPEEFSTLKDIVLLTPFGFSRVNKTPYYSTKVFQ